MSEWPITSRFQGLLNHCVGVSPQYCAASPRNDSDISFEVDVTWHDADLAGFRRDDAGTVWADETRLVLTQKMPFHARHVFLRNAFRDAHNCEEE